MKFRYFLEQAICLKRKSSWRLSLLSIKGGNLQGRFRAAICGLIPLFVLFSCISLAQANDPGDSTKSLRRYVRPTVYFNTYHTPWRNIQSPFLERYKFKQSNLGGYVPMYTSSWFKDDSVTLRTFHFLFSGNILTSRPIFAGLEEQTRILKVNIGLRFFFTSGKNTWFYQLSPFFAHDKTSLERPTWRVISNFIYNRTVSRNFSYRIGLTRTFLFGQVYSLPVLGFRAGPLDDVHFIFQFPRNLQLRFPISKKNWGTVFIRPNGSISNIANQDSLFPVESGKSLQLRRREVNLGFEWYGRVSRSVTLQMATGLTGRRYVALALEDKAGKYDEPFYYEKLRPCAFLTIGISIRFGAAKSVKNNYTLYDVFDLNQQYEGENNGPADNDIPSKNSEIEKIKYKDIEDLMLEEL